MEYKNLTEEKNTDTSNLFTGENNQDINEMEKEKTKTF